MTHVQALPVKLLATSALAGAALPAVGEALQGISTDPGRGDAVATAGVWGGLGLAATGVVGALAYEQVRGPFVERWSVNAAESIGRVTHNLDWSRRSLRVGAAIASVGMGLHVGALAASVAQATDDRSSPMPARTAAISLAAAGAGIVVAHQSARLVLAGVGPVIGHRLFTVGLALGLGSLAGAGAGVVAAQLTARPNSIANDPLFRRDPQSSDFVRSTFPGAIEADQSGAPLRPTDPAKTYNHVTVDGDHWLLPFPP